jgi:transposase
MIPFFGHRSGDDLGLCHRFENSSWIVRSNQNVAQNVDLFDAYSLHTKRIVEPLCQKPVADRRRAKADADNIPATRICRIIQQMRTGEIAQTEM